jgi:hypothetical protein
VLNLTNLNLINLTNPSVLPLLRAPCSQQQQLIGNPMRSTKKMLETIFNVTNVKLNENASFSGYDEFGFDADME